jgi:flagellar protein FlaG
MDGIANVARQQQSQVSSSQTQGRVAQQAQQVAQAQKPSLNDQTAEIAKQAQQHGTRINSKEDMQNLVDQLNNALAPMSTNLQFGVDSQDVFYVSVIDQKTDKMISRFPAEQAQSFLPKMQEVTGILFDHKG